LYKNGTYQIQEFRKSEEDLKQTSFRWNKMLVDAANELPDFLHFDD
jgi:hypothetical protein